jgi:hypothetical protein
MMRTTLDIDDSLLSEAKSLAAKEHTSLTRLIEQGLAMRLRVATAKRTKSGPGTLPVYAGQGGLRETVADSRSNRALYDAADDAS